MTANELRKQFKEIRKNIIDRNVKDKIIFNKVISLDQFKEANTLAIYINTSYEVSTLNIIKEALNLNKTVLCPKIIDDKMNFYKLDSLNNLTIGKYNILEPINNEIYLKPIDLMIVPGVIFDKENNRVGMGKGYYDRFLAINNTYKIGLAYKEQVVDKLQTNEHDIKMDLVITD